MKVTRKCAQCGKKFTAMHPKKKLCSAECRRVYQLEYQRRKYRENLGGYRDKLLAYQHGTREQHRRARQLRMERLRRMAARTEKTTKALHFVRSALAAAYSIANETAVKRALLEAMRAAEKGAK